MQIHIGMKNELLCEFACRIRSRIVYAISYTACNFTRYGKRNAIRIRIQYVNSYNKCELA